MLVAGFLNEARQPGTRADFPVDGCDECIERKLLSFSRRSLYTDIPWRSKCGS